MVQLQIQTKEQIQIQIQIQIDPKWAKAQERPDVQRDKAVTVYCLKYYSY